MRQLLHDLYVYRLNDYPVLTHPFNFPAHSERSLVQVAMLGMKAWVLKSAFGTELVQKGIDFLVCSWYLHVGGPL